MLASHCHEARLIKDSSTVGAVTRNICVLCSSDASCFSLPGRPAPPPVFSRSETRTDEPTALEAAWRRSHLWNSRASCQRSPRATCLPSGRVSVLCNLAWSNVLTILVNDMNDSECWLYMLKTQNDRFGQSFLPAGINFLNQHFNLKNYHKRVSHLYLRLKLC